MGVRAGAYLLLLDSDVHEPFHYEGAANDACDPVIESRKVGSYKRNGVAWTYYAGPQSLSTVGEKRP